MDNIKICPLNNIIYHLKLLNISALNYYDDYNIVYCQKNCAWYDEKNNCCGILNKNNKEAIGE